MNYLLITRDITITTLTSDFNDGCALVYLIDILFGVDLCDKVKDYIMEGQGLKTVTCALESLASIGVDTKDIASSDVVCGTLEKILQLLWNMFIFFFCEKSKIYLLHVTLLTTILR
jgi:hypothetical protein